MYRFRRAFLLLSRSERRYFIAIVAGVLLIVIGLPIAVVKSFREGKDLADAGASVEDYVNPTIVDLDYRFLGSYEKTFNDLNPIHLRVAQKLGINPAQIDYSISEGKHAMRRVESDPYLKVARLTHSEPYLIPEAYRLLRDVAADFARRIDHFNIPRHRIIVTSLTRSEAQRAQLAAVNVNAADNSAHCYGTTFDISWSKFDPVEGIEVSDAILKKHLAAILIQYRKAGRCYIKHERKQACFHITVNEEETHFNSAIP